MLSPAFIALTIIVSSPSSDHSDSTLLRQFELNTDERNCAVSLAMSENTGQIEEAIESLSQIKRAGWLRNGIPESRAESVWQHTLKVVEAARHLHEAMPHLSPNKFALLAFIHDLAEAQIGDITPHDGVSQKDKYEMELAAIQGIATKIGPLGRRLTELWLEFELGKSEEAVLVKQLDKLDALVQAIVYSNEGFTVFEEFRLYTETRIQNPFLQQVFQQLIRNPESLDDPYKTYFDLLTRRSP